MDAASILAEGLFERSLAFLTTPAAPPILRAFDHLGIEADALADALEIRRSELTAWRRGRSDIPDECRVLLLGYLSVLLMWLFGAETNVTGGAAVLAAWRQRTAAARQLLEVEMHAAPHLRQPAQAVADEIDALARQHAVQVAGRAFLPQRQAHRSVIGRVAISPAA